MKIGFFVGEFPVFSETFIMYQITGLIDRGHDVRIFANKPKKPVEKFHEEVERYELLAKTHYFPRRVMERLPYIARGLAALLFRPCPLATLLKLIRLTRYGRYSLRLLVKALAFQGEEAQFDIIHCHFGHNGLEIARLKAVGLISCPFVTTFHGTDVTVNHQAMKEEGRYNLLFQEASFCTFNTDFIVGKLVELGANRENLRKLTNGIILDLFPPQPRERDGDGIFRIFTVSRLVEFKGTEFGIRAVARLVKQRPGIRYAIAGDGPLRESLEALVTELGLEQHVEFLGQVSSEDLRRIFGDCDLFMLNSVIASDGCSEGQGVVLLEAQASGAPVIGSRSGGIPENIVEGRTGFLVPERDPEAVAEKIAYLMDNEELWASMSKAAPQHVAENFDLEKLNDRLVELYGEVVN